MGVASRFYTVTNKFLIVLLINGREYRKQSSQYLQYIIFYLQKQLTIYFWMEDSEDLQVERNEKCETVFLQCNKNVSTMRRQAYRKLCDYTKNFVTDRTGVFSSFQRNRE